MRDERLILSTLWFNDKVSVRVPEVINQTPKYIFSNVLKVDLYGVEG